MSIEETRRFRILFARRDKAAAELAELERQISAACTSYSEAEGFRVRVRPEALRRAVAA